MTNRHSQEHCNKQRRCIAPRCKGMSASGGKQAFTKRCCLCTRHATKKCHHHRVGPSVVVRTVGTAATVGNGVSVRQSKIRGAGNGLFATMGFAQSDVVTQYAGQHLSRTQADAVTNRSHMVSKGGGAATFVNGLKTPVNGRGGASFANDPRTSNGRFKPNITLEQYGNTIYAVVKKGHAIKKGDEMYLSNGDQTMFNQAMGRARVRG